MNLAFEYIKYRWNSKKRHGIHSPFIYELSDKCFSIKMNEEGFNKLQKLFIKLKKDERLVDITDCGAGSKKLTQHRKVKSIFNTSSSKGAYGKALYQLSNYYKPRNILELGTSLGVGSIYLSLGNPLSQLTTVEGCHETRNIALENFKSMHLFNIQSELSTFDEYIHTLTNQKFDLIYIDGHHDGEALTNYIDRLEKFTHNDTLFVLDDIRWSNSMFRAWSGLINDPRFHATIDLFRFGIAIKRKQQEKEHFIVRL